MKGKYALPLVIFLIVAIVVVIFFPEVIDNALSYIEAKFKQFTSSPE